MITTKTLGRQRSLEWSPDGHRLLFDAHVDGTTNATLDEYLSHPKTLHTTTVPLASATFGVAVVADRPGIQALLSAPPPRVPHRLSSPADVPTLAFRF